MIVQHDEIQKLIESIKQHGEIKENDDKVVSPSKASVYHLHSRKTPIQAVQRQHSPNWFSGND